MTKRPFEGKNLDDAISNAAKEFGVETYQLSYHIAVQKRGFLGGTKRVVIEAEPAVDGETAVGVVPATPARASEAVGRQARARVAKKNGDQGAERVDPSTTKQRSDQPGRKKRRRRTRRRGEGNRSNAPVNETAAFSEVPIPEQGERTEAQKRVAEWIEKLVALADFDLVVRTEENDEELIVRLFGREQRSLTAKGGELLDSLQVLANKAFVGRAIEKRIELEVGSFKTDREAELGEKARSVADIVKREGVEKLLPAMSPIERRIVHIALRDDESVETESRGNSFLKRVAIIPRSES